MVGPIGYTYRTDPIRRKKVKATIKLQVQINDNLTIEQLEIYLRDLLVTSVLPTLNADLVPLSLDVKKAR